jgi:serine/threonine-protein kinase RsbW
MRRATAGLGTHLNLTLDEIEDLQIAVDEACALLIGVDDVAAMDKSLNTSFTVDTGVLTVKIDGPAAVLPTDENFAWTMLHALSNGVSTGRGDEGSWIKLTCRGRGVAS